MLSKQEREQLLTQLGGQRRKSPPRLIISTINWEIVAGFLIVLGFLGWVLWQGQPSLVTPATVAFVLVGWVFSLCAHEFAHAATAVLGGDDSPSTRSYLSFNPLRYVNPLFSILLPLLFILLGGIGLPGGAVYLRRDRIRSRAWQSAVSLAGPAASLVCALVLAVPFHVAAIYGHPALAGALAALALFEVFAVVLNLLPIPPLDGFGVIAPWLPAAAQAAAYTLGSFSILIVFVLLWYVPVVNTALFSVVFHALTRIGVPGEFAALGFSTLFFWQH